ncbi:MAG TPA: Stk1 family PASTA domain-containing Ser/Thr kinase [Jiangellaceae bacterium]|nr:Stk1 family PASTA domain-containing Ser/Thr kinase [Jiangellaceae bacterium]
MDVSVSDTPVGRLLDGRYRVETALARGGMATVYRAIDTRLDRVVALKVMHPELAADNEFVLRFIGEARSAARLSHPNVVGVFDQGEDDGTVFLAMEYVEGPTLRQVLRDRGPLPPAPALEMIQPVLAALGAAHDAGIVHRDVKPENVLVGDNGRIKVADFGLARALSDAGGTATRGLLLGTVNYISPEQALGEPATPRSDVYSAGVMLYEMLIGRPPHSGPTDFVIVRSHIDNDVPTPSASDPSIPPVADELVAMATARNPHERFADAGQFAEAAAVALTTVGPAIEGLETREAAGVSITEAMSVPGIDLPEGRAWETTVMPAQAPVLPVRRNLPARREPALPARRERRSDVPTRRASRRRRRWMGPALLVAGLLLAAGVVAGAWWLGEGRYVTVPSLLDMTVDEAAQLADQEGLFVQPGGTEPSEVIEAGNVVRTQPKAGERLLRGQYITLITSSGAERYTVPDLRGKTRDEAEALLEEQNLVPAVEERYDDQVPTGVVIGQGVDPGRELRADEQVPVYVSKGKEPIEIVDFTGQDAGQAEQQLREAGFEVVRQEQPNPNVRPGFVISQSPNSGTGYRGDTITLVVAAQQAQIVVPEVRGQPVSEAERILREAGFTNIKIDRRLTFFPQEIVVDQRPQAGREIKPDQQIELIVR